MKREGWQGWDAYAPFYDWENAQTLGRRDVAFWRRVAGGVGGPVLETIRRDGVTTRFDRQTGAFVAFNADGTIRTFFKPNDGERYYRRQAERVGE